MIKETAMVMFLLMALSIFTSATGAESQVIEGTVSVVDGDTLVFDQIKKTIRLKGVDAPETAQRCLQRSGTAVKCGVESTLYLKRLIADEVVQCVGDQMDAYDRLIATCFLGRKDINAQLVREGFAVAFIKYDTIYLPLEEKARQEQIGIWRYQFDRPSVYRSAKWNAATTDGTPNPACPIKGNITRKGVRIYHMPHSQHYSKTRINVSKGERWFCSEREALDAGWRAVRGL